MTYDLKGMIKRAGKTRRKVLILPPIVPTQSLMMDLARITVQVPDAWRSWTTRILDAYSASLATKDAAPTSTRDSPDDIERELEAAEDELTRLLVTLTPQINDWTVVVDRWHRKKFAQAILTPTGVDLSTLLSPQGDTMESFQNSILALIRNVDDDTRAKIAGEVWRGFQARTPRREIARNISRITGLARKRALVIAQDQTIKMAARLDEARQTEAGFKQYEWMHSGKLHPRIEHVVRNGRRFFWSKPPYDGHPGTLPYCGCKARAYMELD